MYHYIPLPGETKRNQYGISFGTKVADSFYHLGFPTSAQYPLVDKNRRLLDMFYFSPPGSKIAEFWKEKRKKEYKECMQSDLLTCCQGVLYHSANDVNSLNKLFKVSEDDLEEQEEMEGIPRPPQEPVSCMTSSKLKQYFVGFLRDLLPPYLTMTMRWRRSSRGTVNLAEELVIKKKRLA